MRPGDLVEFGAGAAARKGYVEVPGKGAHQVLVRLADAALVGVRREDLRFVERRQAASDFTTGDRVRVAAPDHERGLRLGLTGVVEQVLPATELLRIRINGSVRLLPAWRFDVAPDEWEAAAPDPTRPPTPAPPLDPPAGAARANVLPERGAAPLAKQAENADAADATAAEAAADRTTAGGGDLSGVRESGRSAAALPPPARHPLNVTAAREIAYLLELGVRQKPIAQHYGVTLAAVNAIKAGRSWDEATCLGSSADEHTPERVASVRSAAGRQRALDAIDDLLAEGVGADGDDHANHIAALDLAIWRFDNRARLRALARDFGAPPP